MHVHGEQCRMHRLHTHHQALLIFRQMLYLLFLLLYEIANFPATKFLLVEDLLPSFPLLHQHNRWQKVLWHPAVTCEEERASASMNIFLWVHLLVFRDGS